jgi:hypothetical protein
MSEVKKGTVKEIKRWSDEPYGEYKLYTFTVTMTDGSEGRVNGKDFEHKYYIPGHEVEYVAEEVQKKDGSGSYIKFKKPPKEFGGGGGGYKRSPKSKVEYLSDSIGYYSRYATDVLIAQGKEVTKETLQPLIYAYFEATKPLWDKLYE